MTLDERIEALTMNLELASRDIQDLRTTVRDLQATVQELAKLARQDGENIRALARIAEIHERPVSNLEGDTLS